MASWSADQLAAGKAFFAGNPDPAAVVAAAKQYNLSPEQLADLYSQSTGTTNTSQVVGNINSYLGSTGQTLSGGYIAPTTPQNSYVDPNTGLTSYYQAGIYAAPTQAQAPAPVATPAVAPYTPPVTPTAAPPNPYVGNTSGGLASVAGSANTNNRYSWSPEQLAKGKEFFGGNPDPAAVYAAAKQYNLSPEQLANYYAMSMNAGNESEVQSNIYKYLTSTGQTLSGGYVGNTGGGTVGGGTNLATVGDSTGGGYPTVGGGSLSGTNTTTTGQNRIPPYAGGVPSNMAGLQGTGTINLRPDFVNGLAQDYSNFAGGVLANSQDVYKDWYANDLTTGISPQMQKYYDSLIASQQNPMWSNMLQQGGSMIQQGAQYDPAKMQQFVNPYTDQATQAVYDSANRNLTEKLLPGVNTTFAGAGQFGSTRSGDFTGRMYRDTQEAAAKGAADLQYKGYSAAQDDYQTWANIGQQAGSNLANVAKLGQTIDQQGLTNVGTAANSQQQLEQQSLDATYQDWLKRQQFPAGTLAAVGNALGNTSSSVGSNQFNVGATSTAVPVDNTAKIIAALTQLSGANGQKSIYDVLNLL